MAISELLEYATGSLWHLDSFVGADKIDPEVLSGLDLQGEELLGVYFCSQTNYIVVSSKHLHLCGARTALVIPFRNLEKAEVPDKNAKEIKLTLRSGETAWIEVENETHEEADLKYVFSFLAKLCKVYRSRTEEMKKITSREALISYLREPDYWRERKLVTANWIEKNWPADDRLKDLGIEPSLLEQPDVWRLMALFVTMPIERFEPDEDEQLGLDESCEDGRF